MTTLTCQALDNSWKYSELTYVRNKYSGEIAAFIDAAERRGARVAEAVEDDDESLQDGILSSFRDAAQTYALTWFVNFLQNRKGRLNC
jgi:hypothetical protein